MAHVLITGSSSGLGAAISMACARRGDDVTCLARDRVRLEEVGKECHAASGRATTLIECDVTNAFRMRSELRRVDDVRPVDILIANAGIGGSKVLAPPHGESQAQASHILHVNTLGVINTVSALADRFAERRAGHIVIVGSVASFFALPQSPAYSASKAAINAYAHGLRRLLLTQGVGVTVLSPGFIDTPMSRSLPFARPFLVDVDRAAEIVLQAVRKQKKEVIFPWPFRVAVGLAGVMPTTIVDHILNVASKSAAKKE